MVINMLKKMICVIMLMLVAVLPMTAVASGETGCGCAEGGFASGNGTADAPYIITTAEELRHVEDHPDAHYVLGQSIDLESVGEWKPLCTEIPFSGSFDGQDKVIRNITVSEGTMGGLFASLGEDAVVRNLKLSGSITVGGDMTRAGGLAASSMGTVFGITSTVSLTVQSDAKAEVGGVIGFNGGVVVASIYRGTLANEASDEDCVVGTIIGHAKFTNTALLPNTMITAHSGFGASTDPAELKVDNTLDNIIHSINYGPDVVEIDIRGLDADGDGAMEIWLGHDEVDVNSGVMLEQVLNLMAGRHERSGELDPAYANTVRIQLDSKTNGILDEVFTLLERLEFPYERVVLAGDNHYDHVMENIDSIRSAVEQGMDFWMNPNFILSYEAMADQPDEFIGRIKALGLPEFTVNSNYSSMTEEIQSRLNDEGIQVSIWTLNDTDTLSRHMLRGVYNITTRLQEGLVLREQLRTSGAIGNTYKGSLQLPEIGLCTVPTNEEETDEALEETLEETVTDANESTVTTPEPNEKDGSASKTELLIVVAACATVAVIGVVTLLLVIRKRNKA